VVAEVAHDVYQETERRIRDYFRRRRQLERVERLIRVLLDEHKRLSGLLAAGITMHPTYPAPAYSLAHANTGPSSPVERSLDLAEEHRERLEQRLAEVEERLAELEIERGRLVDETAEMQAVLEQLPPDDLELLRERYDLGLSLQQLAFRLHMSRAAVYRRLREILADVARAAA